MTHKYFDGNLVQIFVQNKYFYPKWVFLFKMSTFVQWSNFVQIKNFCSKQVFLSKNEYFKCICYT